MNLYCYLWRMRNWFLTRILQWKALKKIDNPHKGRYISLNSAKRVCFITDSCTPGISEAVQILRKELTGRGIAYNGICIDSGKEPLSDKLLTSDPQISIIGHKNTNWYGVPQQDTLSEFIGQPFDILIDLTSGKRLFQADYIIKKASASLIIGIDTSTSGQYDMTVSRKDESTTETELVKNIIKYLTTIH